MTFAALLHGEWTAALVNHLWQSTVVVGVAWLLALALRKNHARVRYWVWMAASFKFLLPLSVLTAVGEWVWRLMPVASTARSAVTNPAVTNLAVTKLVEQVTLPFSGFEFSGVEAATPVAVHHMNWWPWVLLAVWVCGVAIVAIRLGRGWWTVYAAMRAALKTNNRGSFDSGWRPITPTATNRPLGTPMHATGSAQHDKAFLIAQVNKRVFAADVPVLLSSSLIEPGIFGMFRPVLLLPEGILERLSVQQMQAIVAHEMCHVQRRDNLTFALHMITEALFWFHPAVWWIGARLVEERELACDEAVVEASGEARVYAEGILNVCKFYVESPVECVAGVTGADLKKRIARIMTERKLLRLDWPKKLALAAVVLMVIAVPLALGLGRAAQTAASTTDIVGIWQGTLHIAQNNRDIRILNKVSRDDKGNLKVLDYSIDQGGRALAANKASFEGGVFKYAIDAIDGTYEGTMTADGKSITGTWKQGGSSLALNFNRTAADAAWPIPEPPKKMAADADPAFEAVTIKPSKPGTTGKLFTGRGRHLITINTNMNDLLSFAYGLHAKQIVGAPDWFDKDLFDIDGVPDVEGDPNDAQSKKMIQKLLADRFELKFHHEQRELAVYLITVAAGGPKMDESADPAGMNPGFMFRGFGDLSVTNNTMGDFAHGMQGAVMDKPVVDRTGLTNRYTFHLRWTPDDSQFGQFRGTNGMRPPAAGDNPDAPPSLYTALQEQLGLKMEAGKAMDDVIVIDHVEKPGEN